MGYISKVAHSVKMENVIRLYASQKKIVGRMFSCPFHGADIHPSAVISSNNKWTCFTCNEHGDAVDFVSKLFNIPLKDAADRLNADFNLGLSASTCCTPAEITREQNRLKERAERKEKLEKRFNEYAQLLREYRKVIIKFAPKTFQDLNDLDSRYVVATKNIDALEHRLSEIDDELIRLKCG